MEQLLELFEKSDLREHDPAFSRGTPKTYSNLMAFTGDILVMT